MTSWPGLPAAARSGCSPGIAQGSLIMTENGKTKTVCFGTSTSLNLLRIIISDLTLSHLSPPLSTFKSSYVFFVFIKWVHRVEVFGDIGA